MTSERDWERFERDYDPMGPKARERRLREAAKLGPQKAGHGSWIVGAGILGLGLLILHHATADDEPAKGKDDKPKTPARVESPPPAPAAPAPSPRSPSPPSSPATSPAARTADEVAALIAKNGIKAQAQDHDGKWYPATIQKVNLHDPDAVRWDPGTPGAIRNPRTGSSPATAVRALGTAPAAVAAAVTPLAKVAAAQLGVDNPLAVLLPPTGGAR